MNNGKRRHVGTAWRRKNMMISMYAKKEKENMKEYRASKELLGMRSSPEVFGAAKVTVRISADRAGKSMSFGIDAENLMIEVPLEPLKDMIKQAYKV